MKKYFILFALILFSLTFVSSALPVTQVQQFPNGFTLAEQQIHTFKFGEVMRYGFILENSTDGKTVDNSSINFCRMVTSNSQGFNTQMTNISYLPEYHLWGIELNETEVLRHFPSIGQYNYLISCQNDVGGALSGVFDVSLTGIEIDPIEVEYHKTGIYFLAILGFILIGLGFLFYSNSGTWITWVGISFMILGFIVLYYDLSLVTMYMESTSMSGSAVTGVFVLFARMIKLLPYITALIIAVLFVKRYREIVKVKKNSDGWDENNY